MVPYGQASDFYPSGHSGFFMIMMRERYLQDRNILVIVLMAGFMMTVIFVLVTFRQHYSIDIFVGVVYGSLMHVLVTPYSYQCDALAAKLRSKVLRWYRTKADSKKKTKEVESSRILLVSLLEKS